MPSALAAGGSSIASAPMAVYGQQEFGNTATDGGSGTGGDVTPERGSNGWWGLPITAGDSLTIDWEAPDAHYLDVFPVGTTDFNVSTTDPVASAHFDIYGTNQLTGKGEVKVAVRRSGTMPLSIAAYAYVGSSNAGPYNFTAYVTHKLVLSIAHTPNGRQHRTLFTVTYRNPDGRAVSDQGMHGSVQLLKHHRWVQLLAGHAGTRFTLRWNARMRGHKWFIREVITGGGYQTATVSTNVIAV